MFVQVFSFQLQSSISCQTFNSGLFRDETFSWLSHLKSNKHDTCPPSTLIATCSKLSESHLAAFVNVIWCKVLSVISAMHLPLRINTHPETHAHTCTQPCPWVTNPPPVKLRTEAPPMKTVILHWTPSPVSGVFRFANRKALLLTLHILADFRQP